MLIEHCVTEKQKGSENEPQNILAADTTLLAQPKDMVHGQQEIVSSHMEEHVSNVEQGSVETPTAI